MKKRSRDIGTLDMTALIDVVFLLLIFFMVSTVFKKDELALLLNLPKSGLEEEGKNAAKVFLVELSPTEVALNGQKTDFTALEENIKTIGDKNTPVELRIDKEVRYERVIALLDILKKYSLLNLNLVTER